MRKKMTKDSSPVFVYMLGTLIGSAFSVGVAALCAYIASVNDTDFDKYFIFLIISAAGGAFLSALFTGSKIKSKRFIAATVQGLITALLFLSAVCIINSFAVSATAFLLPAAGLTAGAAAGLIVSSIR